ncbi:MAG: rRNA adenine N-6-methyltransferase family protein, partial [Methylophilaceae bacterium]|nr:rRNA adenine N-6-methyltransferase family protein [Methylophilaceae bacterium]
MKHQAKKRFGQNFLTDQSVINSLVDAIHPQEGQTLIEIGPGFGALTKPLLSRVTALQAVEIDRDIVNWMHLEYQMP